MAKTVKSLWLKDFEHFISNHTAVAADDLVQANKVKSLREVEQHFWVALVEDGGTTYETESIITPNKIKAYTCECFSEGRQMMCAHIAAALIRVRQYLEQRIQEREARKAVNNAAPADASRLTVRDALENVTPDALLEFVREYARRDRDFSLALKTYFAGTITDAENPYSLVLDSAISKRATAQTLRDPDFRRLRKTLDELMSQMNEAALQSHYRTTYLIGSAILHKLTPFFEKADTARQSLLTEYLRTAFLQVSALHGSSAPPELRELAWSLCLDWGMTAPLPTDLNLEVIRFLSESAQENDRFNRISAYFDRTPYPAPMPVLELFVAALAKKNMPSAVVRVLEDYITHPFVIHAALLILYYLKHPEAVLVAGDRFVPGHTPEGVALPNFTPAQQRELEDILLHVAEKEQDVPRQARLLRQRLRKSNTLDAFHRLKKLLADAWPAELAHMVTQLRESGERTKLATLLAAEGEAAMLADLLSANQDFALFQLHLGALLAWDKAAVRQRYVEFLSHFLEEHFGLPASAQVRMHLQHLMRRGETALAKDIVQALVEAFPDRLTLSAELMELFPKVRGVRPFF